jgi:hypothetical protein
MGRGRTKSLVTHLPDVTDRQVVDRYRRRWSAALLFKELKGATGLGQHQITEEPHQGERSVASSMMTYLIRLKYRAHDIPKRGPWSMFTLKRHFSWQIAQTPLERSVEQRMRKRLQERKAA